jgi:hypothetical protein
VQRFREILIGKIIKGTLLEEGHAVGDAVA